MRMTVEEVTDKMWYITPIIVISGAKEILFNDVCYRLMYHNSIEEKVVKSIGVIEGKIIITVNE